jgi:hypothetical protein
MIGDDHSKRLSPQRAVDSQSDYSFAEHMQQVTDYIWI